MTAATDLRKKLTSKKNLKVANVEENFMQETKGSVIQEGNIKETKNLKSKPIKHFVSYDMVFIFLFAVLCFFSLSVSPFNYMQIGKTLGNVLIVFFPGYVITVILHPKREDVNVWRRLGQSVMLSLLITLAVVIMSRYIGIAGTMPVFIVVTIMTMILTLIASVRLLMFTKDESFYGHLRESGKKFKSSWGRGDLSGKLSLLLIILLFLSIVTVVYLIANPNPTEGFTEFYILGPQGKAVNYPTSVTAGKEEAVLIGLVNHENRETTYRMVVQSNGNIMNQQDITLQQNQKIEIPYNFTMGTSGKLEFLLYKLPDTNVYLSLHLWVNVN